MQILSYYGLSILVAFMVIYLGVIANLRKNKTKFSDRYGYEAIAVITVMSIFWPFSLIVGICHEIFAALAKLADKLT